MSSASDIVIVLSKTTLSNAIDVLDRAVDNAVQRYDFGFRGYGEVLGLDFDGQTFVGERELASGPSGTSKIDRTALTNLVAAEGWFSIGGSIRIDDVDALVDLDIVLMPTFDAEAPAGVVYRLENDLYASIYGRGASYDDGAAGTLVRLCVALGAVDGVDAFQVKLVGDLGEVRPVDSASVRRALICPCSAAEAARGSTLRPGLVAGVRRNLLSPDEVRDTWPDGEILETVTGFVVLSTLVPTR